MPTPDHPPPPAFPDLQSLVLTRRTTAPRRLISPGPDAQQLCALVGLAAAAPDHGQIRPWRLVEVPGPERPRLGAAFEAALLDRDSQATEEQRARARDKASRAPLLLVAVVRLGPDHPEVPAHERWVALGAALQNLLLGAQALGYGSALTSGQAMNSPHLRSLLGLQPQEQAVCCINIGTVGSHKAGPERPSADTLLSVLGAVPGGPAPQLPTA